MKKIQLTLLHKVMSSHQIHIELNPRTTLEVTGVLSQTTCAHAGVQLLLTKHNTYLLVIPDVSKGLWQQHNMIHIF